MRNKWAAMVMVVLASVAGRAAVLTDPSGLFALTAPGADADWRGGQADTDVYNWSSGDLTLVSAKTDLPVNASADMLVDMVKDAKEDFPNARAFATLTVNALAAKRPAIHFECDPRGVHRLIYAVAFPAGGACYVVVAAGTVGKVEPTTLAAIVGSVVEAKAKPTGVGGALTQGLEGLGTPKNDAPQLGWAVQRSGGHSLAGMPAGWQVRRVEGGGLQAYETVANGAWLDMQSVPWQRGAAQLVHDGFAAKAEGVVVDRVLRSRDDQTCQLTYHSPGEQRKGEILAIVREGDALFTRFVAPEAGYAAKRAQLAPVLKAIADGRPAGAGGAQPAPVPQLTRAATGDGTAWASVPAGWTVSGSKGILEAKGPRASVALGGNGIIFTPQAATAWTQVGMAPPPFVADFVPSDQVLPVVISLTGRFLGQPVSDMRLVESRPLPNAPGMAASVCTYNQALAGGQPTAQTTVGIVMSQPLDQSRWMFYVSMVSAETAAFPQLYPTLLAIANTFTVSPAFQAERWSAIQKNQAEITAIIQDVTANRARVAEIGNEKWDAYIRGGTPMIDRNTGQAKVGTPEEIEKWKREDPNADLQPMNDADWRNAKWK